MPGCSRSHAVVRASLASLTTTMRAHGGREAAHALEAVLRRAERVVDRDDDVAADAARRRHRLQEAPRASTTAWRGATRASGLSTSPRASRRQRVAFRRASVARALRRAPSSGSPRGLDESAPRSAARPGGPPRAARAAAPRASRLPRGERLRERPRARSPPGVPEVAVEAVDERHLALGRPERRVLREELPPRRLRRSPMPRRGRRGVRAVVADAVDGGHRREGGGGVSSRERRIRKSQSSKRSNASSKPPAFSTSSRRCIRRDERDVVLEEDPVRVERAAVDEAGLPRRGSARPSPSVCATCSTDV